MFSVTDTIRESLKLAWKHKILWVFALLLASGGGNFPNSSSSSNKSENKSIKNNIKQNIQDNTNSSSKININGQELDKNNVKQQDIENMMKEQFGDDLYKQMQGSELINNSITNYDTKTEDSNTPYVQEIKDFASQLTSKNAQNMLLTGENKLTTLSNEFLSKSIIYIVIVAIAFLFLIIFVIGLTLFMQSWAMGALIGGVDDVLNDKPYTLFSLATWGRKSVKQLLKYNIYLFILTFLIITAGIIIPVIMFAIDNTAFQIVGALILPPPPAILNTPYEF